ncbi:SCO family protein [Rubinisphaera brasiliensis]|uniref:Electron transport protein SCO1/SenC n=1 Tax=Rubinisphaera brasiliensis (strain ATCC 49424 / DSM 5305 / JCM 21570 / IAM 15109 / NBRC 103401 / IFAM 1448) TaxID=756272 RepID=F0SPD5_RUBBR|nr:SCO family protein [Rubinisphaera brasiliensis]ADY62243.1 hypothetical protein Plabr_4672 [Rubinisphaera brasiliensis DSM 5305]
MKRSQLAMFVFWVMAAMLSTSIAKADEELPPITSQPGREFLPSALTKAGVDEHLGETLPLDLEFQDDRGRTVSLGQLFEGDRPVILSLNYSNCPMLCVLQLNGLIDSLREVEMVAGKDFRIVSVSLDPGETVAQAANTKQKYIDSYGKKVNADGWNFLVGTQSNVEQLAEAVGVRYVYLPEKKEYSHPAVFSICMPDGRISRYHYGVEFPPNTIRLSLVEASEGKIGNAFDKFILLCFHYDADEGRYAPTARFLMKIGGIGIILGLGGLFWLCHRMTKRSKRQREEADQSHTGQHGQVAHTI